MKLRRTWRKLHLAVDAASGMIVAQTLTDQNADDPSQVGPLLDQIDDPIGQVTADGAYDGDPTHQAIAQHGNGIAVVIPPRATAVPSGELNTPTRRDRHLAMIVEQGRLAWQATTEYGQRSLIETTVGRYKSLIGPRLRARGCAAQQTEAAIGVAVLNRILVTGRQILSVASRSSDSRLGLGVAHPQSGNAPTSLLIIGAAARPLSREEHIMPVKAGVIRAGARATRRGAVETFTGVVFQDSVITAEAPSRLGGSVITFTPGARTAWHSHPVGQTLFCLSGVGRICFQGEKPQVLNPGDTVNIPPNAMHWHGASPDRLFSHLALSEAGEQGQGTAWGAHVSDADYNEAASGG